MTSLEDQLHHAIESNDIPTVSLLIEQGVNFNHSSSSAPLWRAAGLGHVEIMTLLLDAGADIDAGDQLPETAMYAAISNQRFDALKLLVERGAPIECFLLRVAAKSAQDDKIIVFLLDAGAPFDGLVSVDFINLVAVPASVNVFKRLMLRNIDFCALQSVFLGNLCHAVVLRGSPDRDVDVLIRAVSDAGIDVDADDKHHSKPLHFAATRNSASTRVLVELGADIDSRCAQSDDGTALHIACASSLNASSSYAELLLALGANVHLVDNRGRTASHLAANNTLRAHLCACLAAGGDLDLPDNDGNTVRAIASDGFYVFELPTSDEIDEARRRIAKTRLDLVRQRAFQICIGLHNLNALELCEIMRHAVGALGALIAFHHWWAIATTVKHFHNRKVE